MVKKPTLKDIENILTAGTALNNNWDEIEEAFENTLSRDGSTPNQMEADIDLNSNDLLNVNKITANDFFVDGTDITTTIQESQDAAATSASNAATSEANAAASYDDFDDRYLGSKSSDPSLDNDGDALQTGALYFNTTDERMKVYTGSTWNDAASGALLISNNLSDVDSATTSRDNLGLKGGATTEFFDDVAAVLSDTGTYTDGTIIRYGPHRGTIDSTASSGTYIENSASPTPMRVVPLPGNRGVNVLACGATGDNAADDTTAFEMAAAIAVATGKGVFSPSGYQWYLPGGVTIDGVRWLRLEGYIRGSTATDEILLKYDSTSAAPCDWYVEFAQTCQIKVQGLTNARFESLYCDKLILEADGATAAIRNIAYNNFYLGFCGTLRLDGLTSSPTSWINSNKFYGGRVGTLQITGVYPHNNNTFYGFKMEGCTVTIDGTDGSVGAHGNIFYDTRLEGSCTFTFGVDTFENVLEQSWHQFDGTWFTRTNASHTITNNGHESNMVRPTFDRYWNERELSRITSMTKNHFVNTHSADRAGTVTALVNNQIFYDTGLIRLDHTHVFRLKSDAARFNPEVYAYDAAGTIITTSKLSLADSMPFDSGLNRYRVTGSTPQAAWTTQVEQHPDVTYIKYVVKASTTGTFEWFHLSLFEPKGKFTALANPLGYGADRFASWVQPASGTFEVGDFVWNTSRTELGTSPNKYIILGWTRLTAGSGHVLNTDWLEVRCPTGN